MDFGSLFQAVSGVLHKDTRDNNSVDTDGLIGKVAGMFRQHGASDEQVQNPYQQSAGGGIMPASQDPYGDPADTNQGSSASLPASPDP